MIDTKARIVSNKEVAEGFFRIVLEAPHIAKTAKAGQFVMVRCSEGTNPLLRRPFSFHKIGKNSFELLYKVIGKGTELLSKQKKGRAISVLGPLGNGFDLSAKRYPLNAILVAGGIGVAPLLELAARLAYSVERIAYSIFIGARNKEHLLCEKEFKSLGASVYISTEDGSKGYKGLVTDLLKRHCEPPSAKPPRKGKAAKQSQLEIASVAFGNLAMTVIQPGTIYACGPKPMLKTVAKLAKSIGVHCQVSLEERMACGTGACLGCAIETKDGYKMVCKDGPIFDAEEIVW